MTVWTELSHDPRVEQLAGLRAGDADRDVVQALLSRAYAEGRLTPLEHDQRATSLCRSRTLGDLRLLVADLVPEREPATTRPGPCRSERPSWRRLWLGFLLPSITCVLLWRLGGPGLFWPLWVIVYTGLPLLRAARAGRRQR